MKPKLPKVLTILHCVHDDQGHLNFKLEQHWCDKGSLEGSQAEHHLDAESKVVPNVQQGDIPEHGDLVKISLRLVKHDDRGNARCQELKNNDSNSSNLRR